MLDRIKLLAITTPSAFVVPFIAAAQIDNPIEQDSLRDFLLTLIDIIILVMVPVIIVMIVYAGFMFVTAGGNKEKLTTAKKTLLWALVGAVIILGARIIAAGVAATVDDIAGP